MDSMDKDIFTAGGIVLGSVALFFGLVYAISGLLHVPVEQKVVEIHMTRSSDTNTEEQTKRIRRKTEIVPLLGHATCSGEFIDDKGDILTARHCVEKFDTFEVQTFDNQKYTAVVVATSAVHDLAIVHIDRRNTPFFSLAHKTKRGQTVFVLGSPLGITDTLSTGIIAHIAGDATLLDCSALPGNSGGPVFNRDEELVGVLNAGMVVGMGVTHLNVMQSLDAARFFIEEAMEKRYGHR